MKGTFFNKPLEWNIETEKESWTQGEIIKGNLCVKNHGPGPVDLDNISVAIHYAEIKKVHTRSEGPLKVEAQESFTAFTLAPNEMKQMPFSLSLDPNCSITDKKSSHFLTYGTESVSTQLMLKVEARPLFTKIIGLLDTFYRFKMKDFKSAKKGILFKLSPPDSKEMARLESLSLTLSMDGDQLLMDFDFVIRKLDSMSPVTKFNKETTSLSLNLTPREYSLGRDMIDQDNLLKLIKNTFIKANFNTGL